jgi:hypothetical protein
VNQRCPSLGTLSQDGRFCIKRSGQAPWTCVCMCKTRRRNAINTQEHGACVLRMRFPWNFSEDPMKIQYCDQDRRMQALYCSAYGIMLCSKRVVEVVG